MAETLNDSEKALLKELADRYGLTKDHFFKHKHYTIITRAGVDKIQASANIVIKYSKEEAQCSQDHEYVVLKAIGTTPAGGYMESYGEVSPDNNRMAYPYAMAEKRAMARIVLKLAGFYAIQNVYSEEEAEDFKRSNPAVKTGVVYKE